MKKIFNIANLYLLLAVLLALQDVVYEGGELLSKIIIVIFALFSIILWVITNNKYQLPSFFHGLNILLLIFTLYGVIHIFSHDTDYVEAASSEVSNYTYLLIIYLSLLPIYAFFFFTRKGLLNLSLLQFWGIILLVTFAARFFSYYVVKTSDTEVDGITNNYGYLFVGILPLLVYYSNKTLLQYILLALCTLFVVFSMKRGAILVFFLCLIPFTFHILKQGSRRKRHVIYIFIGLFIIGGIYFVQYLLASNDYFISRLDDTMSGYTSRRDIIKEEIWKYYLHDASTIQQLFGSGANHTLRIAENYAHNDWLEILVNQGFFGVIVYCIYWFSYYHTYKKSKLVLPTTKESAEISTVLLITLIASFILTFYSMSYSNLSIAFTMALGFSLGKMALIQSHDINK